MATRPWEPVLAYWLGDALDTDEGVRARAGLWFRASDETDAAIRERFGALVEEASRGALEAWAEDPRGRLALLLLLDQFRRNLHRDSAEAYAQDPRAVALALDGIARSFDRQVGLVERTFYYLPLEHAEDLGLQDRCVALFDGAVREAPEALREVMGWFRDYAVRHRRVVARFGRFPHRNAVLGRETTPEEEAFLASDEAPF